MSLDVLEGLGLFESWREVDLDSDLPVAILVEYLYIYNYLPPIS